MPSFARIASALAALTLCAISLADPLHPAQKAGDSAPQKSDGYTVKVKLTHLDNYPVLIAFLDGGQRDVNDVSTMEDGYRVFKGSVDGIVMARLLVRNPSSMLKQSKGMIPGPVLSFVVRNGAHVVIEGDAQKPYMATVQSDDRETEAFENFRSKDKVLQDQQWAITKERFSDTSAAADGGATTEDGKYKASLEALEAKRKEGMKEFVKEHPDTYAAMEVFAIYAVEITDAERAAQFAALPPTYKNTALGKRLGGSTVTAVGKPVAPFSAKDSDGKVVDIAALKGKVVLLDFWGSWCVPCRAGHPHLKELYSKYKDKGFEIVGVAWEYGPKDAQEKAWREAIKKDGITWLQVLNDPPPDIVKMYGVIAYPTKILIDRNGVIAGRFSIGDEEAFDAMLSKLMSGEQDRGPAAR